MGRTVVEGEEEHLEDAEQAAGHVEQDAADGEADGALARVVHVGLRHVLDQRHGQLDVRTVVEHREPRQRRCRRRRAAAQHQRRRQADQRPAARPHSLAAALVDEALDAGDERQDGGVDREDDVVGLHRDDAHRVQLKVLLLHAGQPIEAHVEQRVHRMAEHVQRHKVQVQAHNAATANKKTWSFILGCFL